MTDLYTHPIFLYQTLTLARPYNIQIYLDTDNRYNEYAPIFPYRPCPLSPCPLLDIYIDTDIVTDNECTQT